MSDETTTAELESKQEALKRLPLVDLWAKRLEAAERSEAKLWRKEAEKAQKLYEGDRSDGAATSPFNIFHSNVETIVPAVYNSTPIPDVRRRYADKDPIGKNAADVIERALAYHLDVYDFDDAAEAFVKDTATVGRGVPRLRYEPRLVPLINSDGQPAMDESGAPITDVGRQVLTCEHVAWQDFLHGPGKTWSQVPWVAFRLLLDRDRIAQLAGDAIADAIPYEITDGDGNRVDAASDRDVFKRATVWEVWDKDTREVLFICKAFKDRPILVEKDPLGLDGFFPVPRPAQHIRRLGSLIPVSPYELYCDLERELNDITKRISKLIRQLKVRGLIAGQLADDAEEVKTAQDGEYIVAREVEIFLNGGGLEKAVAHWPLDPITNALTALYAQREQVKQTIYEVTGIADILRGQTDASETLGAQQIKAQWGSLRIQRLQSEVQRVIRDLLRMMTEIIASKFTAENLTAMTGIQVAEGDPVMELLRSDAMRSYRIDVESDSTVRADMGRFQQQMTQFMAGTAQFVQSIVPLAQMAPTVAPVMVEVYLAFCRRFKLGKSAEDALENLAQAAMQSVQQQMDPAKKAMKDEAQQIARAGAIANVEKTKAEAANQAAEVMKKTTEVQAQQVETAAIASGQMQEGFVG